MRYLLSFLLLYYCADTAFSQAKSSLKDKRRSVEVPFEYYNNFILVKATFNGFLPLIFIFDTGAEYTILSKPEMARTLGLTYQKEFKIAGSDLSNLLTAYLCRNVRFDMTEKVNAYGQDILVLADDYFKFDEYAGTTVHGIMSANIFSDYIVEINYHRSSLILHERAWFKPDKGFSEINIEMFRNKPYYNTRLQVLRDTVVPVKLLIDTGAALPLLLFSDSHPLLDAPPGAIASEIGIGLGGFLQGYAGRVFRMDLGPFAQNNAISYFQKLDTLLNKPYLNKRNGLIGNGILSRYIVILDYQSEKMWLKPLKSANRPFIFDRSGIHLIAAGSQLNNYYIQNIIAHSPAERAGLLRGDQLLRVGWMPARFLALNGLQMRFQRKPGTKLRIVVKRGEKRLKKKIILEEIL